MERLQTATGTAAVFVISSRQQDDIQLSFAQSSWRSPRCYCYRYCLLLLTYFVAAVGLLLRVTLLRDALLRTIFH